MNQSTPMQRRWLPWWCRPSWMLLGASIPALTLFSLSNPDLSLALAQHFYGMRDFLLALACLLVLAVGATFGESSLPEQIKKRLFGRSHSLNANLPSRLAENLLSTRFDAFLLGVFIVAHLIFFRNFFLHPSLITGVLSGNLELKHDFKTIPGVTTWTQIALVLGMIRGMRWAGTLPGKVRLFSLFHLIFFGTLLVRAVLWSERLALIEGAIPFFLGALPRLVTMGGSPGRIILRGLPLLLPLAAFVLFISFEYFRSWQYYSGFYSSIFEFGWRRLYTYYFEAMNTGAAILQVGGFYDGIAWPISFRAHEQIYDGLYLGTLDVEYNNPGGIHYVASRLGNVVLWPVLFLFGVWQGLTWRAYIEGRFFALFYPITFLGLMEILRIPYWFGENRVVPASVVVILILLWAATLPGRLRVHSARSLRFSSSIHIPPSS